MSELHLNKYITSINCVYPNIYIPSVITIIDDDDELVVDKYNNWKEEKELLKNKNNIIYGRNFNHSINVTNSPYTHMENVLKYLESILKNETFLALELNSSFGLSTCQIAHNKLFKQVITYSDNEYEYNCILRNINIYKSGNKIIVSSKFKSSSINDDLKGCIVFIQNIEYNNNNYYLNNDVLLSIRDFINFNIDKVRVFIVRNPEKANFDLYSKNKLKIVNIDDYTIIINDASRFYNSEGGLSTFKDIYLRKVLNISQDASEYLDGYYYVKSSAKYLVIDEDIMGPNVFDKRKTVLDRWSKSCNIDEIPNIEKCYELAGVERTGKYDESWKKASEVYLWHVIKILSASEDIANKSIDPKYRNPFIRSITHPTVNATNNYESLETMGDAYLKTTFFSYCYRINENITNDEFNSLNDTFMSIFFQPKFARSLRLDEWIVSKINVVDKILEDVFESFNGALYIIGESIQQGVGMYMLKNLIDMLFEDIDLYSQEHDHHIKNKITVVEQLPKRLDINNIYSYNMSKRGNVFTALYEINSNLLNFIKDHNLILPTTMIFSSENIDEKIAKNDAATKFYFELKRCGITDKFAKDYSIRKKLSKGVDQETLYEVEKKMEHLGFVALEPIFYSFKEYKAITLVGIRPNGAKVNIRTSVLNSNNIIKLNTNIILMKNVYETFLKM